jgi:Ubiquitin family
VPEAVVTDLRSLPSEDLTSWYVHLRVRPTATVTINRLKKGKCELRITASKADTVDSLRRKAQQQGLPADNFDVVFNGNKLSSSKPLVAYGVSKGSVLELVPIDSASAPELPASSPPLSSPHHALVRPALPVVVSMLSAKGPVFH